MDELDWSLLIDPPPITDEELLRRLRSGFRFCVSSPGDWEFFVTSGNRIILRRIE